MRKNQLKRKFYVCSYGSSGSWMLTNFLKQFAPTHHIHDRFPPVNLTRPVGEHFGEQLVDPYLRHTVIFIYSRPQFSVSRAYSEHHWRNIGVPQSVQNLIPKRKVDYFDLENDLIDYDGFFSNYVFGKLRYPILCINYHHLWDNLPEIFELLELPNEEICNFPEQLSRPMPADRPLMFESLNLKIDQLSPVCVIPASPVGDVDESPL